MKNGRRSSNWIARLFSIEITLKSRGFANGSIVLGTALMDRGR
jgi:hypothetical protein